MCSLNFIHFVASLMKGMHMAASIKQWNSSKSILNNANANIKQKTTNTDELVIGKRVLSII